MFCFRCGASMPDDAKVCPKCAAPVEVAPPPPPAQQPQAASPQTPQQPTSPWLNVPPAAQYPQGQPYPQVPQYQQAAPTDGKATASLVCGILSILCFGILTGIPAIILGHVSRGTIKRSGGRLQGGGMALAGLILGYASLAISALVITALMIPNLLKAKITANESAAKSSVRTINVSQISYSTTYPDKGYAPDLATLGPGQSNSCGGAGGTAEHACLLDSTLGNYTCTAGSWCTKGAYKYSVSASRDCADTSSSSQESGGVNCSYVVVATPVSSGTGTRSFCSTADAIVRQRFGQVSEPISSQECSSWGPIN
jgi:Domain of unknown function (DUF4190)/zinc-ribbon domain